MIEEQQVVSSTAQLDSPQETAAEEVNVVNESPSEEGGSDNMSLNELTTQLLVENEKQEESGESEVEQTTEEETHFCQYFWIYGTYLRKKVLLHYYFGG